MCLCTYRVCFAHTGNAGEHAYSLCGICCIYIYIYEGFPKLGIPFLWVPIIRTIVFWGLYWGSLVLGNYHIYIYMYMRCELSGAMSDNIDLTSNPKPYTLCKPPEVNKRVMQQIRYNYGV